MRRRRGFKGTWLPILGKSIGDPETGQFWTTNNELVLTPAADTAEPVVGVVPLVLDVPYEPDNVDAFIPALGLYTNNEYALRRIVGKVNVHVEESGSIDLADIVPFRYHVAVGLFVARAGDADETGGGAGSPVGGAAAWSRSYNPLDPNCIREPWLWRRTWQLGSPFNHARQAYRQRIYTGTGPVPTDTDLPTSNARYGSAFDGPHVDARTRRRVGNDDRLWLAAAAHILPFTDNEFQVSESIRINYEIRAFGAQRKARNRGTF